MQIIETYKKMLFSLVPSNLEKQLSEKPGSMTDALKNYALGGVLFSVFYFIYGIISQVFLSIISPLYAANLTSSILNIGLFSVLAPFLFIVINFVFTGIIYIIAKVLGGQGTFTEQFYHFSIINSGYHVATSPLSIIPLLGGLWGMAVGLYYQYPTYLIYKSVHKLSKAKAIILVAIPLVVLFILLIIAVTLLATSIAALTSVMGARR
ncbi:MAG: YIP1 family protein [Candidatus Micrarchaeota archaeon]